MNVKSRREEYAETTRAAIVQAAVEQFASEGFARSTMDNVAEAARVTKGAVYHHFTDKAELFEAVFVVMEERLLARVTAGVSGIDDPFELVATGVDLFLAECCEADFRRIAIQEAPAALGWARWKEIEEQYFLALVAGALGALAQAQLIALPSGDLTARMLLAAMSEAGLAVAASSRPEAERRRAGALVMRFVSGLRDEWAPAPSADL
ncbi:MAG TPA: TetR family transcriptional regulator [Acidimicrobiales bacterium]|jgi:AcrR family transcriptional regulator|nr:TetR family transcriptional regulator [Acidimicrobiales bacterium]